MKFIEYLKEKLDTQKGTNKSPKELDTRLKKFNVRITKRQSDTTGGMRDVWTISLKDKNITDNVYYDFNDVEADFNGDRIRGKTTVDVEGRKEPNSFRVIFNDYFRNKQL